MNAKYPLSSTAALIADPGRAAMLTALLSGGAMPAGELARIAGVSAQSASMHLGQLVNGGFLVARQQGRHRYYSIARPEVAHAVEALGVISTANTYTPTGADRALCYARTCYDHLAGELAVQLRTALERDHLIEAKGDRDYELTRRGEEFLAQWGVDVEALRNSRRSFARRCLDWTVRRDHLAGALGAAICQKLLELRWITRDRRSRAVHVSLNGRRQLERLLALPGV
ncbi:MAG TPA: winged helix-turn-helix domain-containing protein [Bryocella sp.]|nr:winged helix-turn-helix domain-containing protein [Bryocella sp.]